MNISIGWYVSGSMALALALISAIYYTVTSFSVIDEFDEMIVVICFGVCTLTSTFCIIFHS